MTIANHNLQYSKLQRRNILKRVWL